MKIRINWFAFHVRRLCQTTYYHISLRRVRCIFPKNLLLQVYKSYIQPRLDYGVTLYGSGWQKILTWFKGYKIMQQDWNFDYVNSRGIDLVKSLNLYTIRERRDYFLLTLMFKAIHGITPNYFSDRIDMHFDIHGNNTREAGSMNVYLPTVHKEMYKNSFFYIWAANFGMICQILWRTLRI